MPKPRDTFTYDLKQGNKVVYRGTTNIAERREQEHREAGFEFDKLEKTSVSMTKEGAKKQESKNLKTYRSGHGGRNPKYNKDDDG